MKTPMVRTKLYPPAQRFELVARPRLLKYLSQGLSTRLTLVSAPAGYGKTTLLADFAAQVITQANLHAGSKNLQLAWLSLDLDDNDPVCFWTGIVAALKTITPQLGDDSLPMLRIAQPKADPRQVNQIFLMQLINELLTYLQGTSQTLILVLDDYHVITHPIIHSGVSYLLDHLPECMHLVIASRSDPPLLLARMRGRGELHELRQNELRFTPPEVDEFLYLALGYHLSIEDVSSLENRTEGWAAGLQLTAISLRDQPDIPAYIHSLTGNTPFILDYLLEEILLRQPEPIQNFLLCTSILESMCAPLCDALLRSLFAGSDYSPSQQTLEDLYRANLFIIPLDAQREWFRYHHLFTALLRQNLQRRHPDLLPDLHARASAWYASQDYRNEAVRHALSGGLSEQAASLVAGYAQDTLMRSEISTFLRWVDALPEPALQRHPLLLIYRTALILLSGGPVDEAEASLCKIRQADTQNRLGGELNAVYAMIAAYRGDLGGSMTLAQQALAQINEENLFLKSFIAGLLGLNALIHGKDNQSTDRALDDAFRVGMRSGNLISAIVALAHRGELTLYCGKLDQAEAYFHKVRQLAVDRSGQSLPAAGLAFTGLGSLLRLRGQFDAALQSLDAGILLNNRWSPIASVNAHLERGRILRLRADFRAAAEAVQTAQELAQKFDAMLYDDLIVEVEQANLWLAQGRIHATQAWAESNQLYPQHAAPNEHVGNYARLISVNQHQTLARMYLAKKQPALALKVLAPWLQILEASDWNLLLVEVLCLQALAYWHRYERLQAFSALRRALVLAEGQEILFPFLESGLVMRQLLIGYQTEMQNESFATPVRQADFTTRLLIALGENPPAVNPSEDTLVESLSTRELDILALVAQGYSNKEIAHALVVSLHTVKWHLGNIYCKLGVKNRSQAVASTRRLGLIRD